MRRAKYCKHCGAPLIFAKREGARRLCGWCMTDRQRKRREYMKAVKKGELSE